MTTLTPGQSVVLTASPTIGGQPGGVFTAPVTWSCNAANNQSLVTLTPGNPSTTCTLMVQAGSPGGSFTVTATSGSMTAIYIITINSPPPATGMIITAGAPF
jgi:hypothetical protein